MILSFHNSESNWNSSKDRKVFFHWLPTQRWVGDWRGKSEWRNQNESPILKTEVEKANWQSNTNTKRAYRKSNRQLFSSK